MHHAFLIDGYNVVFHRSRLARNCPPHRLRKARESFVALLVHFRAQAGYPVTVVFDGVSEPVGFGLDRVMEGDVEIIYSPRGQTADETLRGLMDRRAAKTNPTLVTSDRELVASARMRAVPVISSAEFVEFVAEETGGSVPTPGKEPSRSDPDVQAKRDGISSQEAENWQKLFGVDDDVEL